MNMDIGQKNLDWIILTVIPAMKHKNLTLCDDVGVFVIINLIAIST